MPQNSQSQKSLTGAEREATSVGVTPIVNCLESAADALDAFLPEEPRETSRKTGTQAHAASGATSNVAATLRLQLESPDFDIHLRNPSQEDRYVSLPISVPPRTVPKSVY